MTVSSCDLIRGTDPGRTLEEPKETMKIVSFITYSKQSPHEYQSAKLLFELNYSMRNYSTGMFLFNYERFNTV